jgi:hypothetical protein
MIFHRFHLFAGKILSLALFLLCSSAGAQVLVYRMEISQEQGINFHTFEGGFFAAPVLGGTGSFLLTSTAEGRTFTESDSAGNLFTAVGEGGKKAVISANTGTGTAHGAFVALGDISYSLSVSSPTTNLSVRIAKTLSGYAVSADDESTVTTPAVDGSIGSAGYTKIKFTLDEGQTNHANQAGLSLSQTMDQLKTELGREGFSAATSSTTTTTTTGTTTGTTGTTATSSATGSGGSGQ